jgi:hypothetical protein
MRNCQKYKCAECGETGFFRRYQFARANKPRCTHCGCGILDPVSLEAIGRIMLHDAVKEEYREIKKAKENNVDHAGDTP